MITYNKKVVWRSHSTNNDLVKNSLWYNRETAIFCQYILTDKPDEYLNYEVVKVFKGKSLIYKEELHTLDTWMSIANMLLWYVYDKKDWMKQVAESFYGQE